MIVWKNTLINNEFFCWVLFLLRQILINNPKYKSELLRTSEFFFIIMITYSWINVYVLIVILQYIFNYYRFDCNNCYLHFPGWGSRWVRREIRAETAEGGRQARRCVFLLDSNNNNFTNMKVWAVHWKSLVQLNFHCTA